MTSFLYNGRRRCDFGVSFIPSLWFRQLQHAVCSCYKETSPTQSDMLGARLDAAQATVTLTKRSSLIFMKFRLCRPSVHTCDKIEFDSLSWTTLSPTRSTLSKVGDLCRPNVECQCVRGQSDTVDFSDFQRSRPCRIRFRHWRQCAGLNRSRSASL